MINQKALKAYLVKRIPPGDFYAKFFNGLVKLGSSWTDAYCPFHNPNWAKQQGKSPSLSIHPSGAFRCHSPNCGLHGQSIINFYDQYHKFPFTKTLRRLYREWVHPIVPEKKIGEWQRNLIDSPWVVKYIVKKRQVPSKLISRFKLGFDGNRITIPIYDQFGLAIDVRRYDPTGKAKRKIISYAKGYGGPRLFPIDNVIAAAGNRIILCEGEWDCMVAIAQGYRAVTVTGGAGDWPYDDADGTDLFKDRSVRIIYDVNDVKSDGVTPTDAGQIGARKIAQILEPVARSVKIIKLPIDIKGGDLTDYFVKLGKTKRELDEVIDAAPTVSARMLQKPPEKETNVPLVRLNEAADASYYYKPIRTDCLISGKNLSPYLPPKKVKATITDEESGDESKEVFDIRTDFNKDILKLVNCSHTQLHTTLCRIHDLPPSTSFDTVESFNMEELRVIPAINLKDFGGSYAIRRALYVGHGLESNRTYRMTGYTLPDPDTQASVHVFNQAVPVQDNIENFKLTEKVRRRLAERFTPETTVESHIRRIARWQSKNITRIVRRQDLHIAIDLVFHSVLSFNFNKEEIPKGWLEAMVIGDTRCGKGYVAEGLSKFYRMGETVTGENCSFAGLIGGLQKNNDHWFVTWGKVPLNDRRLVIIDEASNLSHEQIGQMSRVRSEGVAEIVKIMSERTRARTRLVWLTNPRSGKPINTYNYGVESISEMMGHTEDIARLDYALTVASSEVDSQFINRTREAPDEDDVIKRVRRDSTALIMWAWSRKPDEVEFTPRATQMILQRSIRMGAKYSASIPLIQSENIRIKLAKIAAAVAVKCFSTDKSGERLIVKSHHVRFAHDFLTEIYRKPSMAYDMYSASAISRNQLANEAAVIKTLRSAKQYMGNFVEGLIAQRVITLDDIANFTGTDKFEAQNVLGRLVRLRCLEKEGLGYVKRPGFSKLLKIMMRQHKEER